MPDQTPGNASAIDALLQEHRRFEPSAAFRAAANINDPGIYDRAAKDPEAFWAGFAGELDWITPWTTVLEWTPPYAKWFVGGKLNASVNCLDRHARGPRRNKAALIWEGEPGDRRTLTYFELYREVSQFANVLKALGVQQRRPRRHLHAAGPGAGDRHAGLRPHRRRAQRRLRRLQRRVAARPHQRLAVQGCWSPPTAATGAATSCRSSRSPTRRWPPRRRSARRRRRAAAAPPTCASRCRPGRDHWYHELMAGAPRPTASRSRWTPRTCSTSSTPPAPPASRRASSTPPAATSPAVYATTKWVFDLKEDDVYWCTADIGWVTGHSYVVYGPLANGATVVMYEGAPDWPEKDRFWEIIERYGVTIFYTAPTAIRAFMQLGHRLAGEARPVVAAAARLGRRADQSRSLDVVPRRTSAASAARSSTPGGRPRPAPS